MRSASALVLALALAAVPATAEAAPSPFAASEFVLNLNAAAAATALEIPEPLVLSVGYSAVNLAKESSAADATCEALGAGTYWDRLLDAASVMENSGHEPEERRATPNPTEARDTAPKRDTGSTAMAYGPAVTTGESVYAVPADGTGVRWDAECQDETRGTATGADGEVLGVQTAASTTTARVSRATGEYVGTARAFVSGLQGTSGIVDLVSSVMTVRHVPGREPRISYRIGVTSGPVGQGPLASGVDVPVGELPAQFNQSVRNNAAAVEALGPVGLTLLGPTVTAGRDGRLVVHAPFFELSAGLAARQNRIGQNSHTRLVTIAFEGQYPSG